MDEDRIRKELRSKLLDHETPINLEQVWGGIDQKQNINEGRKRRGLWLFMTAGLFCLLGVGSFYLINAEERKGPFQDKHEAVNKTALNKPLANQKQGIDKKESTADILTQAPAKHIRKKEYADAKKREARKSINKKIVNDRVSLLANTQIKSSKLRQDLSTESTKGQVQELNLSVKEKDGLSFVHPIYINKDFAQVEYEKNTILSKIDFLHIAKISNINHRLNVDELLYQLPEVMKTSKHAPREVITSRATNKKPWLWQLGVHTGVFKNVKEISSLGTNQLYQIEREASETPLETITIGSNVKLIAPSGFLVYTGLEVTQMTERFEFSRIINQTPQSIVQSRITIRNIEKKIYNQLRLVDVPLGIGYIKNYGKWGVELNAGIAYNVAFNAEGQLLSLEILPADIAKLELYQNRIGLSYSGAISLGYQWSSNIKSVLGMKYKNYNGSFNQPESGLLERHKLIGIQLGLSYQF